MEKAAKKLTGAQRRFCALYAWLGNPLEAARMAGWKGSRATAQAVNLLLREEIWAEVERWRERWRGELRHAAAAGLSRLALGGIGDAVRLARGDSLTAEEVEGLNLFAVSELKPAKDGGFEVKFHDRAAALLTLLEREKGPEEAGFTSLCRALEKGASALEPGNMPGDGGAV